MRAVDAVGQGVPAIDVGVADPLLRVGDDPVPEAGVVIIVVVLFFLSRPSGFLFRLLAGCFLRSFLRLFLGLRALFRLFRGSPLGLFLLLRGALRGFLRGLRLGCGLLRGFLGLSGCLFRRFLRGCRLTLRLLLRSLRGRVVLRRCGGRCRLGGRGFRGLLRRFRLGRCLGRLLAGRLGLIS